MIVVKKDVSLHQPLFYCLMLAGIKIFWMVDISKALDPIEAILDPYENMMDVILRLIPNEILVTRKSEDKYISNYFLKTLKLNDRFCFEIS